LAWLQSPESADIELCDISYTATARRQIYPYRMAVTARNKRELVGKLAKASAVHVTTIPGRVVFVFPGQGSQYIGMGESLYRTCPDFKRDIDECHSFLISSGFPGVLEIILTDTVGTELTELHTLEAYQAAIFALEYALMKLWRSWGVKAAAAVGHRFAFYFQIH